MKGLDFPQENFIIIVLFTYIFSLDEREERTLQWRFYSILGDIRGLFQYFVFSIDSKEMQITFGLFAFGQKNGFRISVSLVFGGYRGKFRLSFYSSSLK